LLSLSSALYRSAVYFSTFIRCYIHDEQQLLETAERVVMACSESKLNDNSSECQKLCKSKLCCFDEGDYGCQDDASKDCAVYAACEALVEGLAVGAADENEE